MTKDSECSVMSDDELKDWRRKWNEARLEQIKARANDGTGRGGAAFNLAIKKVVFDDDSLNFNSLSADEVELIGEGLYGPTMMFGPTTRAQLKKRVRVATEGPLAGAIFPHTKDFLQGFEINRLEVLASKLHMPAMRKKSAAERPKPAQEAVKRLRDELRTQHQGKRLAEAIRAAWNLERERAGKRPVERHTVENYLSNLPD